MQTELAYQRVRTGLESLGISPPSTPLDNVLEAARVEEKGTVEVADRLLDIQLVARHARRVETNLKFAGLPYRMRLDDFDFDTQPSIDPQLGGVGRDPARPGDDCGDPGSSAAPLRDAEHPG